MYDITWRSEHGHGKANICKQTNTTERDNSTESFKRPKKKERNEGKIKNETKKYSLANQWSGKMWATVYLTLKIK